METKEYVVCLNKNIDYDQFWNEIENESDEDNFIPQRRVDILNNRDATLRQCHYALTDEEALKLRSDPRVFAVDLLPKFEKRLDISQIGNFNKTTVSTGNNINWGLLRVNSPINNYGIETNINGTYDYTLDGTGVDIVIQDSGIQMNHPEFLTYNNYPYRTVALDWYEASGVSGTMPEGHYRDLNGHGTHVAGIAAGKTYGWAKNAAIYSVKVSGLEGSGDTGGLPVPDCFDVILGWHKNKPIDTTTGYKRPTIVNMSWGYSDWFVNMTGGNYRGNEWTGTTRQPQFGMIGAPRGVIYTHNVRIPIIDAILEEMIEEGIHLTISAGNSYQKCDIPGGADYNNYYVGGYFNGYSPNYYHRGGSPFAENALYVGSIDSTPYSSELDQKAIYSNSGPLVNIWAPGSRIVSSTSTLNEMIGSSEYYADSNFKQLNISGTSMASPQVCGLGALFLQLEPSLTPDQLKDKLQKNSRSLLYSTGLDDDYINQRSITGSGNRIMYNPFNSKDKAKFLNGLPIKNL